MIAQFKIDKPDDVMATLSMTCSLEAWKRLKEQLREQKHIYSNYPSSSLYNLIGLLVDKMEQQLQEEIT